MRSIRTGWSDRSPLLGKWVKLKLVDQVNYPLPCMSFRINLLMTRRQAEPVKRRFLSGNPHRYRLDRMTFRAWVTEFLLTPGEKHFEAFVVLRTTGPIGEAMKRKSKLVSTGHGTGALQPAPLSERLGRQRGRLILRKRARRRSKALRAASRQT